MHKIFLSICFIVCILHINPGFASVRFITDAYDNNSQKTTPTTDLSELLPDPNNQEEVRNFFKKRLEEAATSPMSEDIDWNTPSSINIVQTKEYYEQQAEENKPLFQKMYEKALEALHQDEIATENAHNAYADSQEQQEAATATRFFTIARQPQTPQIIEPEIPTVSLSLPSGRKVLAPAREHIPYFLSYIDIQANGYLKIEDTITIVANGKKFAYGLKRIFPKYSQKKQRIDLILENVSVNDTKVPYTLEEIGNDIIIKPKYNQKLEPGVYTYKFNYLVNNKLIKNNRKLYLDWNLTGHPLNAFITSANAIVTIPNGHKLTDITTLIGRNQQYTDTRTNRYRLADNVIAFSNNTPLLNGENMNIIAILPSKIFIKNFHKSLNNFLISWGDIIYASIGFATILISFILSLISLKYERKNKKYSPSYNGGLMRTIIAGKYDKTAFIAQLLELYRKNALDIKTDENGRISLQKGNVNSTKLIKPEKKALRILFRKKQTAVEINNMNNAVLKKIKKIFEKAINKRIKKYHFVHNIGYILFSIAMLILTEIFISYGSVNMAQSLIILCSTSLLYAFYVWIIMHKFKHWYTSVPMRVLSLIAILLIWIFSSIYIGSITSIIILASTIIIFMFSHIFNKHNNFIDEASDNIKTYKEYLISNADAINLSKDFLNQQSNIFALNIADHFPLNVANKNYYRLDIAENMKQVLIGIIN